LEQWEYKSVKFETTGFSGGILDLSAFDEQGIKIVVVDKE